jgi:predicted dehydrogenase
MKIGLIGIGFMGRGHLDQYLRLRKEGSPIQLTAIADIDPDKFQNIFVKGNLDLGAQQYDFSQFHCYTDAREMLEKEALDAVDIALPTDLHAQYAIAAMEAGLDVLCEKPMALNLAQCDQMIQCAQRTGRKLMIAQVLRFWRSYEILKEFVDSGSLGAPVFFSLFRGGPTPAWSHEGWSKSEARSGGCILDQHIHDVDMLNWLFGAPKAVSTLGRNVIKGAGYDAVSTHYRYDGFIAAASDDWAMNGKDMPFSMSYRANFERGTVVLENGVTKVYPVDGAGYTADDDQGDNGYYREIKYFAQMVAGGEGERVSLASTRMSIAIVEAERKSADLFGAWVPVEKDSKEEQ